MNQPPVVDIVGLGIFLASVFFSPEAAGIVGPYVAIIVASSVGASFAVQRRPRTTRWGAIFYFGRVTGLACVITVFIASVAASYFDSMAPRLLIAPVSLLIGFLGDDAPVYARRAIDFFIQRGQGKAP